MEKIALFVTTMKRREFLPSLAATVGATMLTSQAIALPEEIRPNSPAAYADEDFWEQIRTQFRTGGIINLNNGGVSPHPICVEEAFFDYHRICNEAPSYNMWRRLDIYKQEAKEKLATIAGCGIDEIAINRNTTEALITIINNLPLRPGDEVVLSTFDYPRLMNAWKVRQEREGIVLRWVNPEEGFPDDDTVIQRYISQFTKKTRVVHLTHMINWTGRVIPVKAIIEQAKKTGITTIVDAAHSFAHIPFKIPDLGCDYLGASLHKWLSAPFGSGMLYVNKNKLHTIYPIFPSEKSLYNDIRKFEELGTRNNAAEFAIADAVDFYLQVGIERKYERLLELRDYWVNQVKRHPKIKIHTPLEKGRSGSITLAEIVHRDVHEVDSYLINTYNIHTVGIQHEGINGTRITPNIYTSKSELDLLVKGLLELANTE